jgi:hypothetical protein
MRLIKSDKNWSTEHIRLASISLQLAFATLLVYLHRQIAQSFGPRPHANGVQALHTEEQELRSERYNCVVASSFSGQGHSFRDVASGRQPFKVARRVGEADVTHVQDLEVLLRAHVE